MGHDLNEGHLAVETVIALSRALRRVGVCAYLPTLITAARMKFAAADSHPAGG